MPARFIPIEGLTVAMAPEPTEPELLAASRFVREVRRIAGVTLPILSSGEPKRPALLLGNRASLARLLAGIGYDLPQPEPDAERERQSYRVDLAPGGARRPLLIAVGLGGERSAQGHLGTGYAVGELLRRLNIRNGKWGFELPGKPIAAAPAVLNRTLYIMNSSLRNPGLSVEHFSAEEIEDYVDRLVEARYSRVCFWQWSDYYLYPGNTPSALADRQMIHQKMRAVFARARQRGMTVYHMLTPAHANVDLLPNDPRFVATGYYGRTSVCWSQPEARELAKRMAQLEMEYYGPVDGYAVWFYDPGGCFCAECAAHQSERIFDQLDVVVQMARTISPGARFQAGLWPTWAFAREPRVGHPGRGYTEAEVTAMVADFLRRCLERFGPRGLTILDSCEGDETNIYNGNVKPEQFKRSGFMYTVLGFASEQVYPFAAFRLGYLSDKLGLLRQRGLEEAQLFIQYSATNYPSVFAFADTLYEPRAAWQETAERLASTLAKGASRKPFLNLIGAMEELVRAEERSEADEAIRRLTEAWRSLEKEPHFVGDREWLKGYVLAQQGYHALAQAADDAAFTEALARLRADLARIPMYRDFAERTLSEHIARAHVKTFWAASSKP